MRLFRIFLVILLMVPTLSCRKKVAETDAQPYFNLNEKEKTLTTRAEKCKKIPGKKFDNETEECTDLNLAGQASDEKLACVTMRFHTWDDQKKACVVDPQLVDEYQKSLCAPKGKVFINGACVPRQ